MESKEFDGQVAELTEKFDGVVTRHRSDPTAAALAAAIVSARQTAKADATRSDFLEMCESAWKLGAE